MEALLTAADSDYSQGMVNADTDIAVDEQAWILKAQRSDARAFEALYRLHVDKMTVHLRPGFTALPLTLFWAGFASRNGNMTGFRPFRMCNRPA